MQVHWVTRDNDLSEPGHRRQDCHLVILCSASRRVTGAEMSEGGYVQGAGDDSEGWSLGLTPELFWKNQKILFQTGEEELGELIAHLILKSKAASSATEPVLIKPTENLYLCQSTNRSTHDFEFVIECSISQHRSDEKRKILSLQCPEGKLGSRDLRNKLLRVGTFLDVNKDVIQAGRLLVTCSTGKDLSVGVALAILCTLYDNNGKHAPSYFTISHLALLRV
jgi:tRNA A64-2'-O-ribosylphosphate transferase